jgi:uncharacterized repeat protein (TIGR03803 family)
MSGLTLREIKGDKLTVEEMDSNLIYLEEEAQKYWEADGETGIIPKNSKTIDASCISNLEPYMDSLWEITDSGSTIKPKSDGINIKVEQITLNGDTITEFPTFTGNTSGTCISDLYVHNLGGCSPINLKTDIVPYIETTLSEFTKLLDFDGINYGSRSFDLPIEYNGKLYGTTNQGGTNNLGVLYEFVISSSTITKLFNFDGINYGSRPVDSPIEYNGKLY